MKVSAFHPKPHLLHLQKHAHPIRTLPIDSLFLKPKPAATNTSPTSLKSSPKPTLGARPKSPKTIGNEPIKAPTEGIPRWMLLGGVSIGLAFLLLGIDGQQDALALGPEGPLVEEFWENMRRYALYFLTVSTGVIYTIFQPILELLKNPITAILIIIVTVGSAYLVAQVLSAMVGISDFSYKYGY
ncbi:uncharacterized protein LOC103704226 [Phoenix dactylifera]|uniref:Uncharacterized protein ycf33 n=1 Tax=Phoenix dactylifera TaxID=42345 RepID=A0A8B7BUH9_PHODC|nr:uncharacterized protein LOC103704226 [Phoenix dactylifera]